MPEMGVCYAEPRMELSRRFLGLVGLIVGLAYSSTALARSEHVGKLSERLLRGEDFRVRTQAALALGASANPEAVEPLCAGLADSNITVRAASAAALGRLALGGQACVQARLGVESNEGVRSALTKTLAALTPEPLPELGPDTRLYVALGEVTNRSARSDAFVDGNLRKAFMKRFAEFADVAVAPQGEGPKDAQVLLKKYPKAKGMLLLPRVDVQGENGGLTLRIELSMFSYPERSLLGTASKKLTMPDTPIDDTGSLLELIHIAAEQLAGTVRQTAARI